MFGRISGKLIVGTHEPDKTSFDVVRIAVRLKVLWEIYCAIDLLLQFLGDVLIFVISHLSAVPRIILRRVQRHIDCHGSVWQQVHLFGGVIELTINQSSLDIDTGQSL